jgi:hypothetical protein
MIAGYDTHGIQFLLVIAAMAAVAAVVYFKLIKK